MYRHIVPVPASVVIIYMDVIGKTALRNKAESLGGSLSPVHGMTEVQGNAHILIADIIQKTEGFCGVVNKTLARTSLGLYSTNRGISGL